MDATPLTPATTSKPTGRSSMINDEIDKNCCGICLTAYKSPRILPCKHIFCRMCLKKLADKNQEADKKCPLCRKKIDLSSSGVDKLPMYFEDDDNEDSEVDEDDDDEDDDNDDDYEDTVKGDADEDADENADEDADDDHRDLCVVCENSVPAEYECFQCQKVLCDSCKKNHDTWLKHDVQDLKLDLTQAQDKCEKHPEVKVGYVCLDCGSTLCKECVKSEHSLHQTQTLKSYLMEIDGELRDYSSHIIEKLETFEISKVKFSSETESKVSSNIKNVKILGEDFKTELENACQIENKNQHKGKILLKRMNFIGKRIKKSKRQRKFNHNLISDIKDLQEKITTHKIFFQNNIDDIIDDEIGIMDIQMGRLFSFQIKKNRKSNFFFFFGNINWKLTVQVKPTMDGRQINLSVLLKPFIESEDNMLIESITTTVTISVEGGGEDPMASRIFPKTFNSEKDKLEWEFKYNGKCASRVKVLFQNTNIKRRAQVD